MKYINIVLFTVLLMSLIFQSQCSKPNQITKNYNGPKCIANFCLGEKVQLEKELVKKYGAGYKLEGKFPLHCYEAPKQKLFITFWIYHGLPREIIKIFVSDKPSCNTSYSPNTPFEKLITTEGISLGDVQAKVVETYGKPDFIEKATALNMIGFENHNKLIKEKPFGETILRYVSSENDLLQSSFYIRDGKVSGIEVSVSP